MFCHGYVVNLIECFVFFFFKQKTAYEMRISDWSSDVCSSDLIGGQPHWRANVSTTYETGPARISLTGRYVGGGNINNEYTFKDLNKLTHKGRLYLDLSVAYDLIDNGDRKVALRSEEHTSELQSLMRSSYAVFCLQKNNKQK